MWQCISFCPDFRHTSEKSNIWKLDYFWVSEYWTSSDFRHLLQAKVLYFLSLLVQTYYHKTQQGLELAALHKRTSAIHIRDIFQCNKATCKPGPASSEVKHSFRKIVCSVDQSLNLISSKMTPRVFMRKLILHWAWAQFFEKCHWNSEFARSTIYWKWIVAIFPSLSEKVFNNKE